MTSVKGQAEPGTSESASPMSEPTLSSNDVLVVGATSTTQQSEPASKKRVNFTPGTKSISPGPGKVQQRRPPQQRKKAPGHVNPANIKKENLALLIQKKKECEKKAHDIVLRLIEPDVEKAYLLDNAIRISKHHMDDIIEERKLSRLCGWVLCDNCMDPKDIPKQTYKIRGNKVYDITERKSFCSGKCYSKAVHFKAQLLTSPLWLRDMEEDISFEILEDRETLELQGLSVSFSSVNLSDEESDEENDTNARRDHNEIDGVYQNNDLMRERIRES